MTIAQQRDAEPVVAVRSDDGKRPGDLTAQLLGGAPERLAVAQQVPGERAREGAHRQIEMIAGNHRILYIGVVHEPQGVGLGIVQHDEEVFGIHQGADDRMEAAQHVGHVAIGAGQVRYCEQCALQAFGAFQPCVRCLQRCGRKSTVQMTASELERLKGLIDQVLCAGFRGCGEQKDRRVGLEQPHRDTTAVRRQYWQRTCGGGARQLQLDFARRLDLLTSCCALAIRAHDDSRVAVWKGARKSHDRRSDFSRRSGIHQPRQEIELSGRGSLGAGLDVQETHGRATGRWRCPISNTGTGNALARRHTLGNPLVREGSSGPALPIRWQ